MKRRSRRRRRRIALTERSLRTVIDEDGGQPERIDASRHCRSTSAELLASSLEYRELRSSRRHTAHRSNRCTGCVSRMTRTVAIVSVLLLPGRQRGPRARRYRRPTLRRPIGMARTPIRLQRLPGRDAGMCCLWIESRSVVRRRLLLTVSSCLRGSFVATRCRGRSSERLHRGRGLARVSRRSTPNLSGRGNPEGDATQNTQGAASGGPRNRWRRAPTRTADRSATAPTPSAGHSRIARRSRTPSA